MTILLRREGKVVNHKRIFGVYRAAGLTVRRKKRKRLMRVGQPAFAATRPNQQWAIGSVHDRMASGRKLAYSERGRYLHARMSGAGGRYQPLEPACHAHSRCRDCQARPATAYPDGQRLQNLPRDTSWPGAWRGRLKSFTFSRESRFKMRTWKAFMAASIDRTCHEKCRSAGTCRTRFHARLLLRECVISF